MSCFPSKKKKKKRNKSQTCGKKFVYRPGFLVFVPCFCFLSSLFFLFQLMSEQTKNFYYIKAISEYTKFSSSFARKRCSVY